MQVFNQNHLKIPETFSPVLDKSRWYFKHGEPVLSKILASVFVDNFQWNNLKKPNCEIAKMHIEAHSLN
jgi:hypothetical protein